MSHREERNRKLTTGGRFVHQKREKYCVSHGWIDLFACGGKAAWETKHAACDRLEKSATTGLALPEITAKAA